MIILSAAAILAFMLPKAGAEAAEDHALENREEVLQFLESAFEAQTSLSEEPRSPLSLRRRRKWSLILKKFLYLNIFQQ
ncbi:Uncharacterised protein [Mycobacteroides abscessus subsp. abscessus]|nr:Uncharacterised protein [Mycobacteroides abscessus subsp. abscessus]